MSQQGTPPERIKGGRTERPIVWGLVALVGVGLVIGLMATLGATMAIRALGLGDGGSAAADGSTAEASMYLPTPSPTESSPTAGGGSSGGGESSQAPKPKPKPKAISLSAGQSSVSPMSRIDLVGTFTGGEGAVLQVQRKENGQWSDFPVSVSVNGEEFSTYVQTGRTGKNVFRMADTDSKKVSNTVTVTVGG